ncbi:hypothetical protein HRbin36_00698 [bacterium HR36]|nr:hypothetical protein HRbin36_00698 [bacterium HR36]
MLRQRASRKAAAAVELALLLPIIMFLFVAALDYGRISYYSQILANCARSGALYASDPYAPTAARYRSVAEAALAEATDLTPKPTITWYYEPGSNGRTYVVVTAAWTFQTLISYPGIPHTVALQRIVRMPLAPAAPQ